MKHIYLDYAASTPVDPEVERAMRPYFTEKFGNPGSLHSFGQEAIAAVDRSRETIAKAIGADFREIIFTGSATESNNLAIHGLMRTIHGLARTTHSPRIVVSAVEHESVLETARDLERDGVEVVYLPVDSRGVVDLEKLKSVLNERTVLVSVMYANNEVGTIQPIREISAIIKKFREESNVNGQMSNVATALPLLHTDAAQAFQFLNCNVGELGVDLMTFSAHKIYGPKGIGALFVRQESRIPEPLRYGAGKNQESSSLHASRFTLRAQVTGGGQEFGLRSGTENVPLIVGFAKAVELLFSNSRELENKRITELRDYFWVELKKICPRAEINGAQRAKSKEQRTGHLPFALGNLPSILSVYFPDHLAEDLLTKFDLVGLAVSSGSACRSRAVEPSYVIEALGHSKDGSTRLTTGRAKRSVRFSFGRPTTKEEVDAALKALKKSLWS